jgi:hypothetical protein
MQIRYWKTYFMMKLIGLWPPYLGTGISVSHFSIDLTEIDVEMRLRPWNRNYVGTHFGGSIYSMVDPFLMLMLIKQLGPNYVVWDKSAVIKFKKPGRGRIVAQFRLSKMEVNQIKNDLETNRKMEPVFQVLIKNDSGEVVAEVEKVLYIRSRN